MLPDGQIEVGDDYLETVIIGSDRLIPVFATDLNSRLALDAEVANLPYVAYPNDVFFGRVMDQHILPTIAVPAVPVPMAETALTLAALEMAAIGAAVAWVPASLALERISSGRLVDLSHVLPSCDLSVRAARLLGASGRVEVEIWSRLLAMKAA